MLVLSAGVSQTGAMRTLGERMASFAGADERKQLGATLAFAGIPSAVLNNTPIVTMLIPVVSDLANRGRTSPSKLLVLLSYASMVGGMLTLIGTSTNLIASSVILMLPVVVETASRVGGNPFAFVLAVTFASSADFMTPSATRRTS